MDVATEHRALLEALKAKIDPVYQVGSARVVKTSLTVHGVRVPELRKIAAAWTSRKASWEDTLALSESLWTAPSLEERALAIIILSRNRRRIPELTWDRFDRWRRLLDNWGLTDSLGNSLFGPWLAADFDARKHFLQQLIEDPDVWSRRLALVAIVPLNRDLRTAVPDLTFGLIEQVIDERHPMVTKAVSWALRQLVKTHKPKVEDFVAENRDRLAPLAAREVANKLRTGRKSGRLSQPL